LNFLVFLFRIGFFQYERWTDGMMRYQIIVSLVVLLTAHQVASAAQDSRPEQLILARAAAAIYNAEPEWRHIGGVCTCPKLMREQLGVTVGTWHRSLNGSSDHINVKVYSISTAEAAARWIYRQTHGNHAKGWSVTSYKLGDGANIATNLDTDGGVRYYAYTITVRKGRFLASISGLSQEAVERFARFLVTEMSK
jgi:hypothetical protein